MPKPGDSPDALALFTADRQRWLDQWRDFLANPNVTPETKENLVESTAIAMRNAADLAGFYA